MYFVQFLKRLQPSICEVVITSNFICYILVIIFFCPIPSLWWRQESSVVVIVRLNSDKRTSLLNTSYILNHLCLSFYLLYTPLPHLCSLTQAISGFVWLIRLTQIKILCQNMILLPRFRLSRTRTNRTSMTVIP